MNQLFFILYIFILGFLFGLNFFPRLSFELIVFSSFLWGSVLITCSSMILRVINILFSESNYLFYFLTLLLILLITLFLITKPKINLSHILKMAFFMVIIFLVNLFFITFNFSLGTTDSFTLILLGRTMAFDGLSPSVLNSFTSWGILIPSLNSFNIFLGVDYLATLEINFSLSLICIFFYTGFKISKEILENTQISLLITFFSLLVLISTPMFIIQTFFIHTNLPAATYFLLCVYLSWQYSQNQDNSTLIPLFISLLGLSTCRSETFIYCIPIVFLLLFSVPTISKTLITWASIFLLTISSWLIFLYFTILSGTLILGKDRIILLVFAILLLIIGIWSLRIPIIMQKFRPLFSKFFVFPFLILFLGMIVAKPDHMIVSSITFINNLFLWGQWGVIFWIWLSLIIYHLFAHRNNLNIYFNKLAFSIILIVNCLGFFREPFRLTWNDSANRLITLVFPIILLLLINTISQFIKSFQPKLDNERILLEQ